MEDVLEFAKRAGTFGSNYKNEELAELKVQLRDMSVDRDSVPVLARGLACLKYNHAVQLLAGMWPQFTEEVRNVLLRGGWYTEDKPEKKVQASLALAAAVTGTDPRSTSHLIKAALSGVKNPNGQSGRLASAFVRGWFIPSTGGGNAGEEQWPIDHLNWEHLPIERLDTLLIALTDAAHDPKIFRKPLQVKEAEQRVERSLQRLQATAPNEEARQTVERIKARLPSATGSTAQQPQQRVAPTNPQATSAGRPAEQKAPKTPPAPCSGVAALPPAGLGSDQVRAAQEFTRSFGRISRQMDQMAAQFSLLMGLERPSQPSVEELQTQLAQLKDRLQEGEARRSELQRRLSAAEAERVAQEAAARQARHEAEEAVLQQQALREEFERTRDQLAKTRHAAEAAQQQLTEQRERHERSLQVAKDEERKVFAQKISSDLQTTVQDIRGVLHELPQEEQDVKFLNGCMQQFFTMLQSKGIHI